MTPIRQQYPFLFCLVLFVANMLCWLTRSTGQKRSIVVADADDTWAHNGQTVVFLLGTVCAVLHFSLPSIFLSQTLTHPQMSFFTLKSAVYYRRDSLSGV